MTSSAGGAKGCSDHRFRAPPAYTAQLLTLRLRDKETPPEFDVRSMFASHLDDRDIAESVAELFHAVG